MRRCCIASSCCTLLYSTVQYCRQFIFKTAGALSGAVQKNPAVFANTDILPICFEENPGMMSTFLQARVMVPRRSRLRADDAQGC
jgi:hypothetical protein